MKVKKFTAVLSAASLFAAMLTPITVSHAATTDLYVGANSTYTTIMEAVEAAKDIDPQSEDARVTINVAPGNYEEQVLIEGLNYVTLQQTPNTDGTVNLYWHYCTGYTAGDCGIDGRYDPKINWSDSRTWTGYNEGDEKFTAYKLGQKIGKGTKISYYDTDGVAHKDVAMQKDYLGAYTDQATLFINDKSTNITVKDFNIVNAIPVMVTEGEKAVGVAPEEDRDANHATEYVLPNRYNLTVCDENTPMEATDRVKAALAISNDVEKVKALEALKNLTAGESAYLVRSDKYNERGHAISANGDKITFENVRARGNQDSVYISTGRLYFKNCDLIGGTDYIYGNATAVFDSCKLGAEGMSNKSYGATITAANHDAKNPYGYLFYNCELYNVLDNITTSQFGRPWRQDAQITFYKTLFDDKAVTGASAASIDAAGWSDMSGNEKVKARFYEYGSYTRSGAAVDTSKRHKNESGFGSVLDEWQILEFNPKNYFNNSYWAAKGEWDPMDFAGTIADVIAQLDASTINIPAGEETVFDLPVSSNSNVEFHWVSASDNAVVSDDEKTISVIRPATGEDPIETTVTLYARNTDTGLGDKKDVPVTIAATTDTENVFNIPVTINTSLALASDNNFTVTITKNGALIKEQIFTVPAGETTVSGTMSNIPASSEGISYDMTIVSASDEFTITSPEDGKTTVTGITGTDVPLEITAQKLVDDSVSLDISAEASAGTVSYDLIDLAKSAGADRSISNSDIMTIEYDVAVGTAPTNWQNHSYIDLVSSTPTSSVSTNALASRFNLLKVNTHWTQLDMVDCAGVFSGSSNTENQWLNIAGSLDYSTVNHITTTINYKTKTVSVKASGTGSKQSYTQYTFGGFPTSYTKGKLYLAYYPNTAEDVTLSNVKVTYKKLVSDTGDVVKEPKTVTITSDGSGETAVNANGTYTITGDAAYYFDIPEIVNDSNFKDSNYVTIKYDVMQDTQKEASVDITAYTPDSKYTRENISRIVRARFGNWNQINVFTGDITSHYKTDGSYKNTENQYLNIDNGQAQKQFTTCEYKIDLINKKVILSSSNSESTVSSYEFTDVVTPSNLSDLYLAVYPNGSTITLKNISVTYDTVVSSDEPTETPDGVGVYEYYGTKAYTTNGNPCTDSNTYTFVDSFNDKNIKQFFEDTPNTANIASRFTANYLNYVGGTASDASHPQLSFNGDKGKYIIYYLGYNSGNNVTATVNGNTYTAGAGVNIAYQDGHPERILKLYTIEIEAAKGNTIVFDSSDSYLPDLYSVVIVGKNVLQSRAEQLAAGGNNILEIGSDVDYNSSVVVPGGMSVNITAALKNTAIKSAAGNVDVKLHKDDTETTVTGNNVKFNANGKISFANDGAVMKTDYNDGEKAVSDVCFFKAAEAEAAATKVVYTLSNGTQTTTVERPLTTVISGGSALFGLFVTGVPEGIDVTVTGIELQ